MYDKYINNYYDDIIEELFNMLDFNNDRSSIPNRVRRFCGLPIKYRKIKITQYNIKVIKDKVTGYDIKDDLAILLEIVNSKLEEYCSSNILSGQFTVFGAGMVILQTLFSIICQSGTNFSIRSDGKEIFSAIALDDVSGICILGVVSLYILLILITVLILITPKRNSEIRLRYLIIKIAINECMDKKID